MNINSKAYYRATEFIDLSMVPDLPSISLNVLTHLLRAAMKRPPPANWATQTGESQGGSQFTTTCPHTYPERPMLEARSDVPRL